MDFEINIHVTSSPHLNKYFQYHIWLWNRQQRPAP